MKTNTDTRSAIGIFTALLLLMATIVVASVVLNLWVLTAIPIGFLFGFFLERSDLCGSSAFSEVLLMKDVRKLIVIWIVIVTSMLLFAFGSELGWIQLNPKPPDETIVAFMGGLMVGAGAAFAGGCVVGNIMSGIALMSVGNMLFAAIVILDNWATTYLYMRGWRA
jgi:hypothetical protein